MNKINKEKLGKILGALAIIAAFYFILICTMIIMLAPVKSKSIFYLFDMILFVHQHFSLKIPFSAISQGFYQELLIASAISIVITALLTLGAIAAHKYHEKQRHLFGKASWSNMKDLKEANLLGDDGLIIGQLENGQLIRFDSQEFGSLSAPTRSGKGVGVVIPNLLSWLNSLVVLDVKQECFNITSKYREKVLKQKVFLFDPFSFSTHRYNPLEYLNFNEPDIELQIQRLAGSLYPTGKGGKDFFNLQAQSIFSAIVYLLGVLKREDLLASTFTLTTLAGALNGLKVDLGDSEEIIDLEEVVMTSYKMGFLTDTVHSKFLSFFGQAEAKDQFIGIKGSYEAPLKIFQDSLFEKATETNDFDFRDLRKEKMTIYIGITPDNIGTAKPILNLFFTQLLFENIKQGLPETNLELKHNVLLLMDEFTSIGFMEQYQVSITYLAGYNIRSLIIYQNSTQLSENPPLGYGDKGSETLLENHACQIIYRPKNPKTAEEISKRIGNVTMKSKNQSISSRDILNVSSSKNQVQRALILPQEIMDLKDDEQIIFYNSIKIKCKKALFYKNPYFIDKLKSVSSSLKKIEGLPNKNQLDSAYAKKETTIELPNLKEA